MNLSLLSIFGILLSLTCFLLAVFVYIFGKLKSHRLWVLFNICVAIWGVGMFFIGDKSLPISDAAFWWKYAHLGGIFIPVVFLHFMAELCRKKITVILAFVYAQAVFFVILDFLGRLGYKLEYIFNSFYYVRATTPVYSFMSVLWAASCIFGFIILLKTYVTLSGVRKNQFAHIFFGMIIGFVGGASHFFPAYGIKIYPFNITIAFYSIFVTYAILRHRLLDINVAITRTGIFVVVYSLVLGIPFVAAYSLRFYLIRLLGDNWWIGPLVLSTFLATAGPFIYLYIQRRAEDRLLREQRRYQQTLRRASAGMTRIRNLKKLLNLIVHVVTRTVHLKHSSIYLHDTKEDKFFLQAFRDQRKNKPPYAVEADSVLIKALRHDKQPIVYEEVKQRAQDFNDVILLGMQKEMESLDAAVVVPSLVEEGLLGFIVLGEKISGRLYSQDDLSVFSVLMNQAAIAIENVRYLESLSEAQRQLAQSERLSALGKFAASIVHEVKNPLTVIKTFTEYLPANYQDKAFVDKYSAIVGSEADKMNDLAHKLLDFSKPRALKLEEVDAHKLLDGTLDLLSNDFSKSKIIIIKDYTDEKLIAQIDVNQMKQVFLNLFLNAIDAMASGGTLTVETRLGLRPGLVSTIRGNSQEIRGHSRSGVVSISIKDTGCGIPEESLKHIFEPFYSTKEKGTGLGLAIVYSIIKEHRGDIRVESQTGKGTLFTIELPAIK